MDNLLRLLIVIRGNVSVLRLLSDKGKTVSIEISGKAVDVPEGISAAAAFMLVSKNAFSRTTPVSGAKRAPLCMMGVCFECLLKIDGDENIQGCMVLVKEGMKIERQDGVKNS